MEYTEFDLAKQELIEQNHLLTIYKDKPYRGWYKYIFLTPIENDTDKMFKDIVIRFRLPPAIPLYHELIRNFSSEERLLGIHRFLIGEDLQEKTKEMLKYDTINSYVKSLSEEEVNSFLNRMKDLITFDCNLIPYLHIRKIINKYDSANLELANLLDYETEEIIKKHILSEPDYLNILTKVLNKEISVLKAKELSKNTIFNETMELAI